MFFTITFERPAEYRTVQDPLKGRSTTRELPEKHYPRTSSPRAPRALSETAQTLLAILRKNPDLTRAEIAVQLGLTVDGVKYHLKRLQELKLIRHTGPTKRGRWECF
ncbi:winged helix-turn-helix domain-containing protein [Bdellovibrionota bacterium FG-1]